MSFVGVDVSKKTLEVALLCPEGELKQGSFGNSHEGHEALLTWLASFGACRIAMEATGSYHQLCWPYAPPGGVGQQCQATEHDLQNGLCSSAPYPLHA